MDAPFAAVAQWQQRIGLAANVLVPSAFGKNRPTLVYAKQAIESLW